MLNYILLISATLIWGFGFIAAKWSAPFFSGGMIHALRFFLAAIICLPLIYFKKAHKLNRHQLLQVTIMSLFLGLALYIQTLGILLTTVAKSGFLTTLYAFFTPLIMIIFMNRKFNWKYWLYMGLAMFGIFLLCEADLATFNKGDLLILISSILFAIHILLIEKYVDNFSSPFFLNAYQIIGVSVFSIFIPFFEAEQIQWSALLKFSELGVWGILFLAVFSSIFAFSCQIIAQQKTPAHIVSLIFLLESPFAAIFGYVIYDEKLKFLQIFGCSLIMFAVYLVSTIKRE